MSLLFVEVELMETNNSSIEIREDGYFKSLLFVEVELMETYHS